MKNLKSFDISIEEFDKLEGEHIFSEHYQGKKRETMKRYKKNTLEKHNRKIAKVAAAVAVVLVMGPITANAATNGEFFSRIWGTLGRSSVESHDETVYDEAKNTSYVLSFPAREYVDVDPETAQKLIGDKVAYPSISKEVDGTTITIQSAVRDKNAAVVEYTLENENGVDVLNYSQLKNEGKGADFSDDARFTFGIEDVGNIFVDLDKSTDKKLYCYNYIVLDGAKDSLTMSIYEYPCTVGEYDKQLNAADAAALEELDKAMKISEVKIPVAECVESVVFENAQKGTVEISPLSMKIDMEKGLGLSKTEAYDPYSNYYASVNYQDGTQYVVVEHNKEGAHLCDTEIDNASYTCGNEENKLTHVFNRLVDISKVKSITINDVEYMLN